MKRVKHGGSLGGWTTILALAAIAPSLSRADICAPTFGSRQDLGIIYTNLTECSGLAASRRNANVYYTEEDSGHSANVYMMDGAARHLGYIKFTTWTNRDMEDIAVGPGPLDGVNYLYVGDIGDNYAQFPTKSILRLAEPAVSASQAVSNINVTVYDVIRFQYPDGARDAESLMVDPLTRDIYVVSKREVNVNVYRLPYPQSTTSLMTAQLVTTLTGLSWTVAGDISPSGYEIIVKTGGTIYHWCRQAGQTVGQAMSVAPITLPYIGEPQGEAVCWKADGNGYLTLSEGIGQHLYYYPGTQPTNPPPGGGSETNWPSGVPGYVPHDYNGDGKADLSVFYGAADNWYFFQSGSNVVGVQHWGDPSATPIPGDYDGDGAADVGTYSPATALWSLSLSSNDFIQLQYGWAATIPVPADYDGDSVTDIAVYHPESGTWYLMMSTAGFQTRQFGWATAKPIPADYDGDGKADLAVFDPAKANWYLLCSTEGFKLKQFGWSAAVPVPADYDGDGRANIAVYHEAAGNWYVQSAGGGVQVAQFGFSGTDPVPADYDGDKKADLCVYQPAAGNWYIQQSADGFRLQNFGWSEAQPVASDAAIRLNN